MQCMKKVTAMSFLSPIVIERGAIPLILRVDGGEGARKRISMFGNKPSPIRFPH